MVKRLIILLLIATLVSEAWADGNKKENAWIPLTGVAVVVGGIVLVRALMKGETKCTPGAIRCIDKRQKQQCQSDSTWGAPTPCPFLCNGRLPKEKCTTCDSAKTTGGCEGFYGGVAPPCLRYVKDMYGNCAFALRENCKCSNDPAFPPSPGCNCVIAADGNSSYEQRPAPACNPGITECISAASCRKCQSGGTWDTVVCPSDQICQSGQCVNQPCLCEFGCNPDGSCKECSPEGKIYCDGQIRRICQNGKWIDKPCSPGYVCVLDTCVPPCADLDGFVKGRGLGPWFESYGVKIESKDNNPPIIPYPPHYTYPSWGFRLSWNRVSSGRLSISITNIGLLSMAPPLPNIAAFNQYGPPVKSGFVRNGTGWMFEVEMAQATYLEMNGGYDRFKQPGYYIIGICILP